MKLFSYKAIKEAGDCRKFAVEVLGLPVSADGRCAAIWRGGENTDSVALAKDEWSDHGNGGAGGSIIDLCAIAKFGGASDAAMQQAQEFLGDWLGLTPVVLPQPVKSGNRESRYDELVKAGYKEVKRYDYKDLNGKVIHSVIRLEHSEPEKHKQFVQCTPEHWGLGDTALILYNLAGISGSDWIVVVEGEKDADTLIADGVPATTICGGAKKWRNGNYSEFFKGKKVIILPDNDEVGEVHARMIAVDLINVAAGVKIVKVSRLPKGDITDFYQKESGNWDKVEEMIKVATEIRPEDLRDACDRFAVEEAKAANKSDFRNYIPVQKQVGKHTKTEKEPKQLNNIIEEVHRRFLGFPRKVGEQMFDHDRDTGEIVFLDRQDAVFSWIARKSKRKIDWSKDGGCVTHGQLFEGLYAVARRYEAISYVPNYPRRNDVYYAHKELPEPHPEHKFFWDFVNFFNPADEINRVFIAAFIAAPLFYIQGIPRPLWIIDSTDGQGSGKTTLPEQVAKLYGNGRHGGEVMQTDAAELKYNKVELIRRLVSSEGRLARILLFDNAKDSLKVPELAAMITSRSISGKAPYGRGEESRPNNLTYVITINSAAVDTDLASRAFFIMLKKAPPNATWKMSCDDFIERHRFQIFSDIIDILEKHRVFDCKPHTRFPEFETQVLQSVCRNKQEFEAVIASLKESRDEANIEEELAQRVEEIICQGLLAVKILPGLSPINPEKSKVFIHTAVIEKWFFKELKNEEHPVSLIRTLAKTGLLPRVYEKVTRYPHHGDKRRSGIYWNAKETGEIRIIGIGQENKISEVFI